MTDEGILKFSNAEGVTALNRYHNFLTNYGDFGAMQRIGYVALNNNIPTFSNIPQTFQDLRIVIFGRSNYSATTDTTAIFFNGVTSGTLYSQTRLLGNGSSAISDRLTNQDVIADLTMIPAATSTSGLFGVVTVDILNYRSTSAFKTFIARGASDMNGSGRTELTVGLFRSTNAITSITGPYAYQLPQQYSAGSTAALYGVKASAA